MRLTPNWQQFYLQILEDRIEVELKEKRTCKVLYEDSLGDLIVMVTANVSITTEDTDKVIRIIGDNWKQKRPLYFAANPDNIPPSITCQLTFEQTEPQTS